MNKGQTVKGGLDVNIPNALSILRILLTPLFAALIYAVMIALLLFPDMPEPLAAGGVFTCVFMVLMCLVMYLADYARVLRGEKR